MIASNTTFSRLAHTLWGAALRKTVLNRFLRRRKRRLIAMGYFSEKLDFVEKWSKLETEDSNFYYDLDPLNEIHLVNMIALVTKSSPKVIEKYIEELKNDLVLKKHLENSKRVLPGRRDTEIFYGRRLGWYAFIRVMKPSLVVETGVEHGVGSCVITCALMKNTSEGFPGRYLGTDIRGDAGELFAEPYSNFGEILYGDSIESLKKISEPIDIFINDSDHSAAYEYNEYLTISSKLSGNSIILGDNSHVTDCLARFSRETNRKFVFFSEKPKNHWYPGAGIGISFTS